MNVDTGELRRFAVVAGGAGKSAAEAAAKMAGFTRVPKEHEAEADKFLAGKDSFFVDMTQQTPLTDWARRERGKRKKSQWSKVRKARRKEGRL